MLNSNNKVVRWILPGFVAIIMFLGLVLNMFSPSTTGNSVLDINNISSSDLEMAKKYYNLNLDKIPKFILTMFGNERINIKTMDWENETRFLLVTKKGKIIQLEKGKHDDPTMEIEVNRSTIDRIAESENQVGELRKAIKAKEIYYRAYATKTRIRMILARTAFTIYSWF